MLNDDRPAQDPTPARPGAFRLAGRFGLEGRPARSGLLRGLETLGAHGIGSEPSGHHPGVLRLGRGAPPVGPRFQRHRA